MLYPKQECDPTTARAGNTGRGNHGYTILIDYRTQCWNLYIPRRSSYQIAYIANILRNKSHYKDARVNLSVMRMARD